jgi:MFS family permease
VYVYLFISTLSITYHIDSSSLTTTIAQDSFKAYFNYPSQRTIGALVSTYIAGEAVGACFAAWSGDALGRKKTIAVAAGVAVIGTVIQTAAVHIGMLICEFS